MKITFKKHANNIEHNFYGNQYVDLKIKRLSRIKATVKPQGFQFKGYKEVAVICLLLTPVIYFGHMAASKSLPCYDPQATVKCISPIAEASYTFSTKPQAYKVPELAPATEREQNMEIIRRIWGRSAYIGLAIARAESGYRSEAINHNTNGTTDQGVFQVNTVHNIPNMLDATANIAYAYSLYLQQGTSPWDSSKHNWINWIGDASSK